MGVAKEDGEPYHFRNTRCASLAKRVGLSRRYSSIWDANASLAICETACRLGIHFDTVKTTDQKDIKALRNTRQPGN